MTREPCSDVIEEEVPAAGTIIPPVLFSPRLERIGRKVLDFDVGLGGSGGAGGGGSSRFQTPVEEGSDLERTPRAGMSKDVSPGHGD